MSCRRWNLRRYQAQFIGNLTFQLRQFIISNTRRMWHIPLLTRLQVIYQYMEPEPQCHSLTRWTIHHSMVPLFIFIYCCGWTRGVQVKLWDPLRTRAIPERLRGVFTTRRYTNTRLPLPYLYLDHPQSGVVYNFGRVCLSDDNFRKPRRRKFIFAHPVYLQGIWVKFTGAEYQNQRAMCSCLPKKVSLQLSSEQSVGDYYYYIIKCIYIAQNRVMQLMRWIDSHTANKNVFSLCLNVSTEMSGARIQQEDCSMF